MALHPRAGQKATPSDLVDVADLISDYYLKQPDMNNPEHRVVFGTSGHRGSASNNSFNESQILAISQAICDYRKEQNISGPLYLGKDTHALSTPAEKTALEVFAANEVNVFCTTGYTPTPAVSHAILSHNRDKESDHADGVVITPSHNPPDNGGFKYNPPNGGPADSVATNWIAERANALLLDANNQVRRVDYATACAAKTTRQFDYVTPYVSELDKVIDMKAIRDANISICADAMGGSGLAYWKAIADEYCLNIQQRNNHVDYTFNFMTLDKDGKIRMDCSSASAMASLIDLKDEYAIAFGNDTDFDRHGIVTPSVGLMNPNHYLAVAIHYLFTHRPKWPQNTAIGKTLVSSSMIDRVAVSLGRDLKEVPVGFKWFVDGLVSGDYGFGGEESAGASFLRIDGSTWTTDKDGIILCLLACEILAVTGKDPGQYYQELTEQFGAPVYARIDAPANADQKAKLSTLSAEDVTADLLAGEPIIAKLTHASANGAAIGGLKVCTENGWFAARPSGTEDVYKIYAESFVSADHLKQIQDEAKGIVMAVIS